MDAATESLEERVAGEDEEGSNVVVNSCELGWEGEGEGLALGLGLGLGLARGHLESKYGWTVMDNKKMFRFLAAKVGYSGRFLGVGRSSGWTT